MQTDFKSMECSISKPDTLKCLKLLKVKGYPCVITSASLLSHSSSRVVEVLDTSRRFLGASISEKNDKADNVGDTETNSKGW